MNIGIIGAGAMGTTLAVLLRRQGHEVAIASSRGPLRAGAPAPESGARLAVTDVVEARDVVILAIPTKVVPQLPAALFAGVPTATVIVDLCNYHPELRDDRIDAIEEGMLESEWVARQIGRPVVKAFNNIFAASLRDKGAARTTPGRLALPVAGESSAARALVLGLIDALGFDPVDAGRECWRQGTGTPAYCKDLDESGLRRALARADRNLIREYRAAEEARIRASLPLPT